MSAKDEADFELTADALAVLLETGLYDEGDIYSLQKCEVESLFDIYDGDITATYVIDEMKSGCSSGDEDAVSRFTLDELEKLVALMQANKHSGSAVRFSVRFEAHVERSVKVSKIFKDTNE